MDQRFPQVPGVNDFSVPRDTFFEGHKRIYDLLSPTNLQQGDEPFGPLLFPPCDSKRSKIVVKKFAPFDVDEYEAQRCLRELHLLRSLSHAHLQKFLGSYTTAQLPGELQAFYVISEYAGASLTVVIDENLASSRKKYGMSQVRKWTRCLLEAVQYLNSQAVIHRNISPRSICIRSDGHLTLLGLSESRPIETRMEMTARRGDSPYAPIEMLVDWKGSYGREHPSAVDVWSTTATMVEMITGRQLFPKLQGDQFLDPLLRLCGKADARLLEKMTDEYAEWLSVHQSGFDEREDNTLIDFVISTTNTDDNGRQKGRKITADDVADVSVALSSFLNNTLRLDPRDRHSTSECLAHEFIRGTGLSERALPQVSPEERNQILRETLWMELHP